MAQKEEGEAVLVRTATRGALKGGLSTTPLPMPRPSLSHLPKVGGKERRRGYAALTRQAWRLGSGWIGTTTPTANPRTPAGTDAHAVPTARRASQIPPPSPAPSDPAAVSGCRRREVDHCGLRARRITQNPPQHVPLEPSGSGAKGPRARLQRPTGRPARAYRWQSPH